MASKRGRPRKTGLDWFPFEVGLLTDRKLRAPRAHHGPAAALTCLALLTLIYQDKGYYLDYRESVREDVALDVSDLISGRDRVKPEEIMVIIEELAEPNGLPKVRECAKWSAARKQNLQARIRGEGAQAEGP